MASPAPRRRWRRLGPHEYTLRMGPVTVEVTRWHSSIKTDDDVWGFRVYLGTQAPYAVAFLRGHHAGVGAPLAQCKADAIAAVERWRDGIR